MKCRSQFSGNILRQTRRSTPSIVIALLTLITAAAASSNAQGTPQNAAQNQPVDQGSKKATAQSRNENVYRRIGIQHANQIPLNFPVPPYPNNVVKTDFLSTTKGNMSASASIFTKDSPASVFNFYLSACNKANFKVRSHKPGETGKPGKPDRFYLLNATKDKQELNIVCFQNRKSQGTLITMSLSVHR
jgi:hypothetical protein